MRLEALSSDLSSLLARMGEAQPLDIKSLADALARQGAPPGTQSATIVARGEPHAALGVLAEFDASAAPWLDAMRRFLAMLPTRLRRLSYVDVERLVERLATRLRESVGSDRLARARFVGIPRGGVIVLGMLAYALRLESPQLRSSQDTSRPLVVVDDCAYSGAGLHEYLAGETADEVIFAPLLAPAPLLERVGQTETRVSTCVSAAELADHTPANGAGEAWRSNWTERLERPRYWVGVTEYVCFPWGEPDWSYWDEHAQQVQDGWSVMPPELCLEHRWSSDRARLPVQVQEPGRGPLQAGTHVIYGGHDDTVALVDTVTGRHFGLRGVGAAAWRAVLEQGDVDPAARSLATVYEADPTTVREDLAEFVEELLGVGLLQRFGEPAETRT